MDCRKGMRGLRKWLCGLLLLTFHFGLQAQTRTVHYYYTDPQGSVLAKTDAQGNIIARYDYKPYGSVVQTAKPDGPGYTGHVNDPETGLSYMQQRYYDPIGRFISPDPIVPSPGNLSEFNRYDYVGDNPVNRIDPDGRYPEPWYVRAWTATKGFFTSKAWSRTVERVGSAAAAGEEGEESGGSVALDMAAEESFSDQMELENAKGSKGGLYSNLKDHPSVGAGKAFTKAQKINILNQNKAANGGVLKSDMDGTELVAPQQSRAGVTPPENEAAVDHISPRNPADPSAPRGTNSYSNAQVLSRRQNQIKSNTPPPPPRDPQY